VTRQKTKASLFMWYLSLHILAIGYSETAGRNSTQWTEGF